MPCAIGIKLSEPDRHALLAVDGAGPFGPPERSMGGYVSLPVQWRKPTKQTTDWITRSLELATSLPPKARKAKAPRQA